MKFLRPTLVAPGGTLIQFGETSFTREDRKFKAQEITIHQLSWWFFIFGHLSPLKPRRHYHVANVTRQRRFLLKRLLQLSTRSTGRLEIQLLIAFVLHLLSIDF